MNRTTSLTPVFVEFIPDRLEAGILYVSQRYQTAVHMCCCGCGLEVVTPLNEAKWRLTETNGKLSIHPSIGNWSYPCQSHYWIEDNHVIWDHAFSAVEIAAVKRRDRMDVEATSRTDLGGTRTLRRRLAAVGRAVWNFVVNRLKKNGG
jgi:hypothetical protein